MPQPLFHVVALFDLPGRGIVVVTDSPVSQANFDLRGSDIEFARPDGSRLRAFVRGVDFPNPCRSDSPFAFLVGGGVTRADIEIGAAVWQVPQSAA